MSIKGPPQNPKNPDNTCKKCAHWLGPGTQMVMQVTPQGIACTPFAELLKAGQLPKNPETINIAQCTLNPEWKPLPENHWCGQFKIDWSNG